MVLTDRFEAMGTQAEIVVVDGGPAVLHQARARLAALEARWSRFRTGSDVSSLNRCSGSSVPVAPETLLLLDRAVAGARATEGRFDPTIGAAMAEHGYDRSFPAVAAHAATLHPLAAIDASWPLIETDHERGTAYLPEGTVFDPGGIGKGLAADLVVADLADQAAGLLVNVGGDLRMTGAAPHESGWVVSIDHPFEGGHELGRLSIPAGAVATSSALRRCWLTADGPVHHVMDPRTGRPAANDVATVTVVAGEAWWAEVMATSLFVGGGSGMADLGATAEAVVVHRDGTWVATPAFQAVLA